jgi:pimeloyl-ACP methyl ester carboxylesterase
MHGAWCWDKVVPLLATAGQKVVTPDLPAHGRDKTPRASITLKSYVDKVIEVMEAQAEPVILVGHSMAGVVLNQAAGQRPELIKRLVYVTAHSINPGESITGSRPLAPDALITKYLYLDEKVGGITIDRERIKEVFYNLCSEKDIAWAAERLVPQPPQPFNDILDVDLAVVDAVPKNYIVCLRDRTIPAYRQEQLAANWTMDRIDRLDSDHSPFLSMPSELVDVLKKAG